MFLSAFDRFSVNDDGQCLFNFRSSGFILGRQLEAAAQPVYRLVDIKPGIIGGKFEQDPPRLPKIQGKEIIPVDLFCDVQTCT